MAFNNPFKSNTPEAPEATTSPQTPQPVPSGRSLPTGPAGGSRLPSAPGEGAFGSPLAYDGPDDEELALNRAKRSGTVQRGPALGTAHDPVLQAVRSNMDELRRRHPTGGLRASRYITSQVLMDAPAGYFDQFDADVQAGVRKVRDELVANGRSSLINDAKAHPTDDAYQDEAFYVVHSLASEYLNRRTGGTPWNDVQRAIILSLICNEAIGFGQLEPLWRDSTIDEIMCNGPRDVQVEIRGQVRRVPGCAFRDQDHLMALIEQLYQAIGKTVSQTTPLVKGRLHDKSRMFAVHPSIAPDGPNFSIRRHPSTYWTPEELVRRGSSSEEVMSFIGNLVHKGASFIVNGGTHSGKSLALDTPIKTPLGDIAMGDIKVGDLVFDHHGDAVPVTHIFDNPARQVYEVTFSTGESIFCDAEHNWYVSTHESRKANRYRETANFGVSGERKRRYSDETNARIAALLQDATSEPITLQTAMDSIGIRSIPNPLREELADLRQRDGLLSAMACYRAFLTYGQGFRADQRHLRPPLWSTMTTVEMLESGILHSSSRTGHRRHNYHIPVLEQTVHYGSVEHPSAAPDDLPIHPYALGLWLGDGSSHGTYLACGAPEDIAHYSSRLAELGVETTTSLDHKGLGLLHLKGLKQHLRDLGVIQKASDTQSNKRVPVAYLTASPEARMYLLEGLVDSDGSNYSNCPGWVFSNTNRHLIDGFINVASSLGYKTTIRARQTGYTYQGEHRKGKPSWDATIATRDTLASLPRKIATHAEMVSQHPTTNGRQLDVSIVDIRPVEGRVEAMRCITVDSKDHTYMVGNGFITTHNTSMLNALTGFYKPDVRILTLEDNIEMKPNPKKLLAAAMECRMPAVDRPNDHGVTMRDLVKSSLQMRPDVIVVGEVTDDAAFDLCQALNTGHAGASTIHANSSQEVVSRLASLIAQGGLVTTEGSLELIASAFDFIVTLKHFPLDGSRRIISVDEVGRTPMVINGLLTLPITPIWVFVDEGLNDAGKVQGHWEKVGDISPERRANKLLDIEEDLTWTELRELSSILEQELPST